MKTRNLLLAGIITLSGMLILSSCEKEDESMAEEEPATEAEAAEMVAYSLSEGTSGITADIEITVTLTSEAVDEGRLSCGESADTTIVTSAGSSLITYQNTKTYQYELECDESGKPVMLDASFSYNGTFDAPRLASTHSVNGDFEITDIENTSDMYMVNGTWQRSGSFESKIRNQANRETTIQFDLVNVAVEKEPKEIDNGTIYFSMTGGTGRGSFSYEGTIILTGNGEATIEISGNRYFTDLETGEIEED